MKRIFSFILAMTLVSLSSFAGDLLTAAMFHEWSGPEAGATITSETTYCEYQINEAATSAGNVYGNSSVKANCYADLSSYAKLVLTFTEGTPRLLFNRPTDTSNDYVNITSAQHEYVTVNEDGTWTIDLEAINKAWGFVHLNAMKGANWANVCITNAELFLPGPPEFPTPKASALADDGETIQYLYNADAQAFLLGSNDWNTRASVSSAKGYQCKVAKNEGGATWTINDYVETQNAWKAVFADNASSIWVDNLTGNHVHDWVFTTLEDGKFTISNPSAAAGLLGMVTTDGATDTRLYLTEDATAATTWYAVSEEDYAQWLTKAAKWNQEMIQYNAAQQLQEVGGKYVEDLTLTPWTRTFTGEGEVGTFELNTWSNEADDSEIRAPFIQSWVWGGAGAKLSAMKIQHTVLTKLPEGLYDVAITVRAYNEQAGSATPTGVKFVANGSAVDISEGQAFTFNNMAGVWDNYVIPAYVKADGTLDFSIEVYDPNLSWIAFKNFSVVNNGKSVFPVTQLTEEAVMENWTITSGDTFHRNTWSGEADESGMKTPFIEAWVGSGKKLSDATISYKTLEGLAAGDYEVKLFARAFNENNTTDYPSGITFFANESKAVMAEVGTQAIYNSASTELYTTFDVKCTVAEDGILNIGFELQDVVGDWLAFKNLEIIYNDTNVPVVTPVTGKQSAATEAAQKAAVDAFNTLPTPATYEVAKAAIAASQKSADFYAPYANAINALDEDGAATFAASDIAADYEAGIIDESDPTALRAAALAAQKAQSTAGSSLSLAGSTDKSAWTLASGTYDYAVERYSASAYTGTPEAPTKVIYQTISGLIPGAVYEVNYLATANMAWIGATTGANIAQLYANDETLDIEVIDQTSCQPSDYPRTLQAKADANGNFEFGIQNIGTGGNWYVVQFTDLTLISLPYTDYTVVQKSEVGSSYETIQMDLTEELAKIEKDLGCTVADMKIYAVQPDGTYDADYSLGTSDGWKDANGGWSNWGNSATRFCVKADFLGVTDPDFPYPGFYYVGGYHEGEHMDQATTYLATYAFKNGQKEAHLTFNLVYVELPTPIYTLVEDASQIIPVQRVVNKAYVGDTCTYDTELVCTALGIESVGDATVYGLNASYAWTVDNVEWIKNAVGKYDGWRDINGDFSARSDQAAICVKINATEGGGDGTLWVCTHPDREPKVTDLPINAYWVLAANEKAVIIDTQITFVAEESDEATAINSVENTSANSVNVYDLMGRKVNTIARGQIYIINGKKVMMK